MAPSCTISTVAKAVVAWSLTRWAAASFIASGTRCAATACDTDCGFALDFAAN